MRFSNNVQQLLDTNGWTAKRLMITLGVTKMTVWRWRKKKCNPEKQYLKAIAELFKVKQSEVINVIDD